MKTNKKFALVLAALVALLAFVVLAPQAWAAVEVPQIKETSWDLTENYVKWSPNSGGGWSRVEKWRAASGTPTTTATYDQGAAHQAVYGWRRWKLEAKWASPACVNPHLETVWHDTTVYYTDPNCFGNNDYLPQCLAEKSNVPATDQFQYGGGGGDTYARTSSGKSTLSILNGDANYSYKIRVGVTVLYTISYCPNGVDQFNYTMPDANIRVYGQVPVNGVVEFWIDGNKTPDVTPSVTGPNNKWFRWTMGATIMDKVPLY